ncbi:MAG: OmpH family outer membrane protein [Planctomycetaceae bacterium]
MVNRFNAGLAALAFAALALAGVIGSSRPLEAQTAAPQRIGFVDMAEVFKKYEKFTVLREELKRDYEANEREGKAIMEKIKQVQAQMQQLNADSPDYSERDRQFISLQAELANLQRKTEREVMERTTKINKTVYLEVVDMVNGLARSNSYGMVIRISRPPADLDADPSATMQWMNQLVVTYDPADDLTNDVIEYLNERYARSGGASPRPAPPNRVAPVSGTAPGGATRGGVAPADLRPRGGFPGNP